MPRLLRPYIDVETKCRVALNGLGEMWPDDYLKIRLGHRGYGPILEVLLVRLAELLGCEVAELRLDHNPPLGGRKKVFAKGEHIEYDPPANSIMHLKYRPHGARFAGSHDVKTRVRGERGQLSDIALVKRNRRLEEREGTRPKSYRTRTREKRKAAKGVDRIKRHGGFGRKSKALKGANRWPPKGSQKFRRGR